MLATPLRVWRHLCYYAWHTIVLMHATPLRVRVGGCVQECAGLTRTLPAVDMDDPVLRQLCYHMCSNTETPLLLRMAAPRVECFGFRIQGLVVRVWL